MQAILLRKLGQRVVYHGGCVTALIAEFLDPFDLVNIQELHSQECEQ